MKGIASNLATSSCSGPGEAWKKVHQIKVNKVQEPKLSSKALKSDHFSTTS